MLDNQKKAGGGVCEVCYMKFGGISTGFGTTDLVFTNTMEREGTSGRRGLLL